MPGQIMEGLSLRHRGAPRRPGEDDRLGHLRQGEFLGQGRGRGEGRAHPGDHQTGNIFPFQDLQLLLDGAEQGGVAGVDPDHPPAGPVPRHEPGANLGQVEFGGVDELGPGVGPPQHRRRHQGPGVEHQVGPGQGLLPLDRDELRVAGTGPHEDDGMAFSHVIFLFLLRDVGQPAFALIQWGIDRQIPT